MLLVLSVFATGCAVEASGDEDEVTAETQADLTVAPLLAPGGLKTPKSPLIGPQFHKPGSQSAAPPSKADEVSEPEPDPWKPDARIDVENPSPIGVGTTPDRSDNHK